MNSATYKKAPTSTTTCPTTSANHGNWTISFGMTQSKPLSLSPILWMAFGFWQLNRFWVCNWFPLPFPPIPVIFFSMTLFAHQMIYFRYILFISFVVHSFHHIFILCNHFSLLFLSFFSVVNLFFVNNFFIYFHIFGQQFADCVTLFCVVCPSQWKAL